MRWKEKAWQGHYDNIIEYVSSIITSIKAHLLNISPTRLHQRAPMGRAFLEALRPTGFCAVFA